MVTGLRVELLEQHPVLIDHIAVGHVVAIVGVVVTHPVFRVGRMSRLLHVSSVHLVDGHLILIRL